MSRRKGLVQRSCMADQSQLNRSYQKEWRQKGFIAVTILLSGMIILLLGVSLLTLHVHEAQAFQSSRNRVCAHYTAEAGMELMLWELYEWGEEVIRDYEALVQQGVIRDDTGTGSGFDSHLHLKLYQMLLQANQHGDDLLPSPFQGLNAGECGEAPEDQEDEGNEHLHLRLKVESDPSKKQLTVTVQGICQRARVTQRAVVDLPAVRQETSECGNFIEAYITSLYLVSRVQCPSPWE